jgi:transcription elongation GreA/GreB family factor
MDKLELKRRISMKAFETFEATLEMHRATQQDMADDTLDAENDANEMADDSNKLETLDDIEQLAEIMDAREDERLQLGKLIPVLHEEVTIGSVVITNERNFFTGGSVAPFEVDGVDYLGISPEAPIYKVLEGKKAGDTVEFREVMYEIKEVF